MFLSVDRRSYGVDYSVYFSRKALEKPLFLLESEPISQA
jgi:hypothetical protein